MTTETLDLGDLVDQAYERGREEGWAIKRLGGQGILSSSDLADFTEQRRALWDAFSSGRELSVPQMREIAQGDSADRRMREIRVLIEPRGWTIRRKRVGKRMFTYKLDKLQGELI